MECRCAMTEKRAYGYLAHLPFQEYPNRHYLRVEIAVLCLYLVADRLVYAEMEYVRPDGEIPDHRDSLIAMDSQRAVQFQQCPLKHERACGQMYGPFRDREM